LEKLPLKSVHTDRYNSFLKLIIAARKQAGLTQQELADRLKKPQSYVSKYERGERRLDVVEFLVIAETLDFNPYSLLKKINSGLRKNGGAK
jgi:transcriptional regulator with XRE-family HTH domain